MKPLLIVLISLVLFRCAPSDSQRVEQAEKDVFALHDTVMTHMGDLLKAKKQLRQRIAQLDSLTAGSPDRVSPTERVRADEQKAEAQRLYTRVDEADMGMMSWMENYKSDTLKTLPPAEALRYLASEKTKINDVNVKINTSLRQSRTFLDQ